MIDAGTNQAVSLRDVVDSDAAILFQQQLDPVANWMAAFTPQDPGDWAAFIARWERMLNSDTVHMKTVLEGDTVAGSVLVYEEDGRWEVSYWLGREFWGRGIATQALALFLTEEETRPLFARVVKDNVGSLRVLQKCGFVIIGEDSGFANAREAEVEEFVLALEQA